MKQHWLVIPIDMKYDNRAGPLNWVEPAAVAAVPNDAGVPEVEGIAENQAPVPRRQNRQMFAEQELRIQPARAERAARDPQGHPIGTRYGFKLDRDTQKQIDNCFETPELAQQYAEKLASQAPGKQYGIFACVRVFETTTPQVITKRFTESGELVLEVPPAGEQA